VVGGRSPTRAPARPRHWSQHGFRLTYGIAGAVLLEVGETMTLENLGVWLEPRPLKGASRAASHGDVVACALAIAMSA
jgi:hypothetical protein